MTDHLMLTIEALAKENALLRALLQEGIDETEGRYAAKTEGWLRRHEDTGSLYSRTLAALKEPPPK